AEGGGGADDAAEVGGILDTGASDDGRLRAIQSGQKIIDWGWRFSSAAGEDSAVEVEANCSFKYIARDDINRRIARHSRLVSLGVCRFREEAGDFEVAGKEPLDDFFTLGDEETGLADQISLAQIAIGVNSRIIDRRYGNERHERIMRGPKSARR